jgi:hypothetical protein
MRRRRAAAFLVVVGVTALVAFSTTSFLGDSRKSDAGAKGSKKVRPIVLPGGGTKILPDRRVVAFYGSPGGKVLGQLGAGTPSQVAEQLAEQAADYDSISRPVLPAFELIATIVHDFPGKDGKYRSRLSDAQIDEYLAAARQEQGILILDVQPGRADFMDEVRHYEKYLVQSDVSLALDPEWSMRKGEIPGKDIGQTTAATINEVSAYLDQIVQKHKLPQKLLIVHEFTESMIENRSAIVERPGLAMVFNVDGFGEPEAKTGKYNDLTSDPERPQHVFTGFKLFYEEDTRNGSRLMTWAEVLDLDPQPDVIVYE